MIVWHGKNFNVQIFSDNINVINVKLCMMVLLTEIDLLILLAVNVTIFQGHSGINSQNISENFKFLAKIIEMSGQSCGW